MMKHWFWLLLFFCSKVNAQRSYALTFTPSLLPMGNIALTPGVFIRVNERYSSMTELSFPITNNTKDKFEEADFFRITSEVRVHPGSSLEGRYIGLQLGYTHRKFVDDDSGSYVHRYFDDAATGYSSVVVTSPVIFAAFKYGREVVEWKRFYMDYFLGLGIRYAMADYGAVGSYIRPVLVKPKDPPFYLENHAWEYDRNVVKLHGSMGVRIGVRF